MLHDMLEPEPKPKNEGIVVYKVVTEILATMNAPSGICKLFKKRYKQGLAKYHQPLMSKDGRDTKCDLIQELVDAVMYSAKGMAEGIPGMKTMLTHSMEGVLMFYDLYNGNINEAGRNAETN